jgi:hypothetical protein
MKILLSAIFFLFSFLNAAFGDENSFACKTKKHIILVNKIAAESYRYRAWNIPKKTSDKPDVEIKNGKMSYEGTGVCGSHVFKFSNGKVEYIVIDSATCGPSGTPKNATGSLDVKINGEEKASYWCVE